MGKKCKCGVNITWGDNPKGYYEEDGNYHECSLPAKCTRCGAPIYWRLVEGRPKPFDTADKSKWHYCQPGDIEDHKSQARKTDQPEEKIKNAQLTEMQRTIDEMYKMIKKIANKLEA